MSGVGHGHGRGGQAGFTLMEILIAMTILMFGLVPMMAVFITAMANLNRAVEDTYAAAVAQSVVDSIRLGLKDQKVEYPDGTRFFILDHDGWTPVSQSDEDPRTQLEKDRAGAGAVRISEIDITQEQHRAALFQRDYVIVLPNDTETETPPGGGTRGKAFLYPRKDPGDNAARKGVEYVEGTLTGPDGRPVRTRKVKIEKTYQLARKLKASATEIEANDVYHQYSFACTIRTAKAPDLANPGAPVSAQQPLKGLYEVVVYVFRNFNPDPTSRRNDPVGGIGRQFITYVSE